MKKKNYLILNDDFIQFCKLNKIDDIEGYASKIFNEAFVRVKYPTLTIKKTPPPIQPIVNEVSEPNKPQENNLYDE